MIELKTNVNILQWKLDNYDISQKVMNKIDLLLDDDCTDEDFEKYLNSYLWEQLNKRRKNEDTLSRV